MSGNYAGRTPDATNTGRGLPYRKARSVPCSAVPRSADALTFPERGVVPVLIGPKNCELMTGLPWRFVRDHARALGIVPLKVGKKLCVPAEAFVRALQGAVAVEPDAVELTDPAAALRAQLGLRLVAANDAMRTTNAPLSGGFDGETASHSSPLPRRKPRRASE